MVRCSSITKENSSNSDLFHRAMSSIVLAGERIHFKAPKPV